IVPTLIVRCTAWALPVGYNPGRGDAMSRLIHEAMSGVLLIVLFGALFGAARAARPADDPSLLVAVNKLGDTVAFFDTRTHERVATIPLATHPHEIILGPDGRTAYVSIYGDGVYGRNTHPGHTIPLLDLQRPQ